VNYVLDADRHGLKIPNLRRLVAEGSHASGVKGVVPTVTYPAHTTMVTGVSPAKHGILTNNPFDPLSKNMGGWYWYADEIKTKTLWEAALQKGLKVSAVDWPVTVGAQIPFLIPQLFSGPQPAPNDARILRTVSTPGLVQEVEKAVGEYPAGYIYTLEADGKRAAANRYVIQTKKADLHLAYLSSLDEEQHLSGPFSRGSLEILKGIDRLVGQLRETFERVHRGNSVVCVVSDHGFVRVEKEIRLNALFRKRGWIQTDDKGIVQSWQVFAWGADGSAAIVLNNFKDKLLHNEVKRTLEELKEDPNNGIALLLDQNSTGELGGFNGATFVLGMKPGYSNSKDLDLPLIVRKESQGGEHGYLPTLADMDAAFFMVGKRIPAGVNLGRMDMRDIAPTLAEILGLKLEQAEGKSLHTVITGKKMP